MAHDDPGAPPEPTESNRVPPDLTREYIGRGIQVQWYAGRCIHSAACIRALPTVFDPRRRPWIDLSADEATADAVATAVLRCPTGALRYVRTDGGPQEEAPATVKIRAIRNGPYFIQGPVELVDDATGDVKRESRLALCRCGKSKHAPLCDNSHRATD